MTNARAFQRSGVSHVGSAVALILASFMLWVTWPDEGNPAARWYVWVEVLTVALAAYRLIWKMRTPAVSITPWSVTTHADPRKVQEVHFANVASWRRLPSEVVIVDREGKKVEIDLGELSDGDRAEAGTQLEALLRGHGVESA